MEKTIQYGIDALLMDMDGVNGNVKDASHIASMGGTWMMLAYGLGGMQDYHVKLAFWPRRAPEDRAMLPYHVTYHGQMLDVEIAIGEAKYTLREGDSLVIRHEAE